jgi:hypothetical protein
MPSNDTNTAPLAHVGSTAELGGRTCEQGCNGCEDCTDYDDEPDDQCLHCRGDGMDPDCDYLLPCPYCGGAQ